MLLGLGLAPTLQQQIGHAQLQPKQLPGVGGALHGVGQDADQIIHPPVRSAQRLQRLRDLLMLRVQGRGLGQHAEGALHIAGALLPDPRLPQQPAHAHGGGGGRQVPVGLGQLGPGVDGRLRRPRRPRPELGREHVGIPQLQGGALLVVVRAGQGAVGQRGLVQPLSRAGGQVLDPHGLHVIGHHLVERAVLVCQRHALRPLLVHLLEAHGLQVHLLGRVAPTFALRLDVDLDGLGADIGAEVYLDGLAGLGDHRRGR